MNSFLGYLAIGFIRLLGSISLSAAQSVGALIGKMLLARRTRSREVARVNLSLVYPDKTESERELLLRDTLVENGKAMAETGPMWGYEPTKTAAMIRQVHGEALYDELMQHDGGKLVLAPHLGNWEIINNYFAKRQHDITIMYRPAKMPTFNEWMVSRREGIGCKLVPTTRAGVMGLFSTLKQGGLVGFLPDQEPRRQSGVFADFMGVSTLTPKLPHEMMKKTGAKAIYAFAKRLPDAQGFDIYFVKPDEELYSDVTEVSAASMNRGIAECIALCPEQYQWTYKRFKRQPDEQPNPYKVAKVP